MRRVFAPANLALAVLGVITVALLVLAIQKQNSLSSTVGAALPAASPAPPATTSQPAVAFIGDGYTSGSPAGGLGPANYTALLANRNGWRVTNTSAYGTGFVAGRPFAEQASRAVAAAPQLVVVSGGRADSGSDPAEVRDAAERLIRDLQTRLPNAKIVVIGPMWVGEAPPERAFAIRDAVRDATNSVRVPFVDPIADNWLAGDDDAMAPSGEDLNDRGHQRLADLVGESIRRAGVSPT